MNKVTFYATRTTLSHYIPLCAICKMQGLRKLIQVNNPGQPNEKKGKNCDEVPGGIRMAFESQLNLSKD